MTSKFVKYFSCIAIWNASASLCFGQAEAPLGTYDTPAIRAQVGSESVFWNDSFTNATGPNSAATNAPGGSVLANATVMQTTTGAFIAGGSSGGDIYSFSSTNTFLLNYTATHSAFSNGVGAIVFQVETSGTELDYTSVLLTVTNCNGTQTYTATRAELYRAQTNNGFGNSADVLSEYQWPSLPSGVTGFSIAFNGSGTSVALERVMLDASPAAGASGPFSLVGVPATIARWMYPFNGEPNNRTSASAFAAFGSLGSFDTRDGQYLLGWATSNSIATNQGATRYVITNAQITLTFNSDLYYVYDGTLRDYRSYILKTDPRYVASADTNSVVEIYAAGFRGGFTNSQGAYTAYNALNYPQAGPYGASPSGGDYTNRVAYAACYDTNGVLVDVSNNVGDNGTNEEASPFEVAPFALGTNASYTNGQRMPQGSQLTFNINLADPHIYGYLQQALNTGDLDLIASCLVNANYFGGTKPNWADFITIFNITAYPYQYPLLTLQGTVLPPCTQPLNRPQVLSFSRTNSTNELHFTFAPNRSYNIAYSDDLVTWQTITNPVLNYTSDWLSKTGTNQYAYPAPVYAVWRDTNTTSAKRFYSVGVK